MPTPSETTSPPAADNVIDMETGRVTTMPRPGDAFRSGGVVIPRGLMFGAVGFVGGVIFTAWLLSIMNNRGRG